MVRIVKLIVGAVLFSTPLMLPAQVFEFEDPEPLPFNVNSDAQEVLPLLSHDGKTLYFSRSLYDLNSPGRDPCRKFGIHNSGCRWSAFALDCGRDQIETPMIGIG